MSAHPTATCGTGFQPFAAHPTATCGTGFQPVTATRQHGIAGPRERGRRTPHRVPCRVQLDDDRNGQTIALIGQTVNVSTGGLAVRLNRDLPIGTPVEVLVPHLDGEPILVNGMVIHSRRALAGIYEVGIATQRTVAN